MRFETKLEYRSKPVSTMGLLSVFSLILFCFLVSTSLDFQQGLKATMPQSSSSGLVATDKLAVVIVDHEGKYLPYFNNKPVSWDRLEEELVEVVQEKTLTTEKNGHSVQRRPVLSLKADKAVPYEYVITVLDIVRHMNIEVNLVTSPLSEEVQKSE
ncbi:biopolymer transporter ExbD [Lentisphaera profundi]|uniref:Biopolymer transporter ExbD n=1 Tax=Lentisphaera profundi TaxID=1658616 RepID=A0ABY7VYG9_9BACT|nr:biopolymer transporter ExbD [Lentisphaera profundi]WDE98767.1 biopolymer transporter ExbD [Lentisphaera profundi]